MRRTLVLSPSGVSVISTSVLRAGIGWSGSSHPKVNTTLRSDTTSTNSPTPGCLPWASTRYTPPARGSSSASVPIHRMCWEGSVRKGKMVAGLASITTSRVSSAISVSFLSFGRFGQGLQLLQTSGPVLIEKLAESDHLGLVGPVEPPCPVAALDDQFGLPQNAEMLGDGRSEEHTAEL